VRIQKVWIQRVKDQDGNIKIRIKMEILRCGDY
jgi:hypothetical protein